MYKENDTLKWKCCTNKWLLNESVYKQMILNESVFNTNDTKWKSVIGYLMVLDESVYNINDSKWKDVQTSDL